MKKIIYCFVAALALIACTPKNGADQVVRIGVSLDDNTQPNQKGQQRISAADKGDIIEILWEKDDVLYYQLDGSQTINVEYPFKLISGAGTKQAIFECETLEDLSSNTFTLHYNGAANPAGVIPFDQASPVDSINNDYLFYTATNCKIGGGITLLPKFSILGIKLTSTSVVNFSKYVAIGTDWGKSGTTYKCNAGSVSISPENSCMYYIVFPDEYDLTGQQIRLIVSQGHNCSKTLTLPNITLSSKEAKILSLEITRNINKSEDDNDAYTIAPVVSSN